MYICIYENDNDMKNVTYTTVIEGNKVEILKKYRTRTQYEYYLTIYMGETDIESILIYNPLHLTKKINYYCFSFEDFKVKDEIRYEDVPSLCEQFQIKKNLINPIYLS